MSSDVVCPFSGPLSSRAVTSRQVNVVPGSADWQGTTGAATTVAFTRSTGVPRSAPPSRIVVDGGHNTNTPAEVATTKTPTTPASRRRKGRRQPQVGRGEVRRAGGQAAILIRPAPVAGGSAG